MAELITFVMFAVVRVAVFSWVFSNEPRKQKVNRMLNDLFE